jgi:tRNA pseudouridine38-40 synthase
MYTYKLFLMYDGTRYSGWQIQPHSLSIQQIVQDAVRVIVREQVNVIGSGRTDAGVHALEQVAHFRSESPHKPESLLRSLNGMLPKDIRASLLEEVPNTFHAQRSAISKEYHYRICTADFVPPFERLYMWHVRYKLDLDLLEPAFNQFIGKHDFTSFANAAHTGACAKNPIRTITHLALLPTPNGFTLQFRADGFLYKMVRNIVGMLIEVASLKRPVGDIAKVLAARDRRQAPQSAPAQGLFLAKVYY